MKKTLNSPIYKPIKGEFLVPSYYKDFICKGADCRNTCCSGWSVKISMKEYFFLHGFSCKKDLREKLDRAIKPLSNRTESNYAEITFDHNNKCKLLSKDGWCLLHKHYGENVLSSVCRYFPRGPKINYRWESSTSNGCERTLELLLEDNEPIQYEMKELTFYMPLSKDQNESDAAIYSLVRNKSIEILQDRSISLPKRIMKLGKLLKGLDEQIPIHKIDFTVFDYQSDIQHSIAFAMTMGDWFIQNTGTFSDYFIQIKQTYDDLDIVTEYNKRRTDFTKAFPDHEIMFEKVLNNNIFFKQFPFQSYTNNFTDEFIALAGKYFILRYLTVNLLDGSSTMEDFIDLVTKLFRVIAHTGFEKNVMILMKTIKLDQFEDLGKLIMI